MPSNEPYTPNKAPTGDFAVISAGVGWIRVSGWAKDPDTPDSPIAVHVYVGGPVGSGATGYSIDADLYRSDVGYHAFDKVIYVSASGSNVPIYAYAIDSSRQGPNPQIGTEQRATIGKDSEKPVISNVQISDISWKGYTVTCDVSDNVKVDRVAFPTWTLDDGQDDLPADWGQSMLGTINNGKATYRVNTSAHGRQTRCVYRTHIYAYDAAGNSISTGQDVTVPSAISNVRVSQISADSYRVECDIASEWHTQRVQFPSWTENNEQDDLIWHEGTLSGNHASCVIKTSDHNNEIGCNYRTHIYAWDADGHVTKASQREFECLVVRVPDRIQKPTFTAHVEDGNSVHLEWTASPLINDIDIRSYTVSINALYMTPSVIVEGIVGTSEDIDLSSFSPGAGLEYRVTAVNDATGDVSEAGYWSDGFFCGEFEAPELLNMRDGETLRFADWLFQMEPYLGIRTNINRFEMTSSDASIVHIEHDETRTNAYENKIVATGTGTATLTLGFTGQPNTVRTMRVRVLPSESTVMNLPDGLNTIGEEAFAGTALASIAIPDGCTTIADRAFADSTALKRLYIPATVTNIAYDAFENSPNVTIYAPEGSRAIGLARTLNIPCVVTE